MAENGPISKSTLVPPPSTLSDGDISRLWVFEKHHYVRHGSKGENLLPEERNLLRRVLQSEPGARDWAGKLADFQKRFGLQRDLGDLGREAWHKVEVVGKYIEELIREGQSPSPAEIGAWTQQTLEEGVKELAGKHEGVEAPLSMRDPLLTQASKKVEPGWRLLSRGASPTPQTLPTAQSGALSGASAGHTVIPASPSGLGLEFRVDSPPPPPPPTAADAFDLSQAVVRADSPPDIASWPITAAITSIDLGPGGLNIMFTRKEDQPNGPKRWPDITPPGWGGPLQYTIWLALKVNGQWQTAGIVQCWYDSLHDSQVWGGDITQNNQIARNWLYDGRTGPMQGYQPQPGEEIGLMVVSGNERFVKDSSQSIRERSNMVLVKMPAAAGVNLPIENAPGPTPTPTPTPAPGSDWLMPGQEILSNSPAPIYSQNRQFFLYNQDGNLVLYRDRNTVSPVPNNDPVVWTSSSGGNPGAIAVMQNDGNLVLTGADGSTPVPGGFDTKTAGHPGAAMSVQNDGSVAIFDTDRTTRLWSSSSLVPPGQRIIGGPAIFSPSKKFFLYLQDGNLVLYQSKSSLSPVPPNDPVVWFSGSGGHPGTTVAMQGDGNLVLVQSDGKTAVPNPGGFNSGTAGQLGAYAAVTDDGHLVVFAKDGVTRLWQSK